MRSLFFEIFRSVELVWALWFVSLAALHRPHQTLPDTVAAEMTRFLARPGCD